MPTTQFPFDPSLSPEEHDLVELALTTPTELGQTVQYGQALNVQYSILLEKRLKSLNESSKRLERLTKYLLIATAFLLVGAFLTDLQKVVQLLWGIIR
jgi:hypothetical protein